LQGLTQQEANEQEEHRPDSAQIAQPENEHLFERVRSHGFEANFQRGEPLREIAFLVFHSLTQLSVLLGDFLQFLPHLVDLNSQLAKLLLQSIHLGSHLANLCFQCIHIRSELTDVRFQSIHIGSEFVKCFI